MINLNSVELFKDLLTLEYDGIFIDLHNDYILSRIEYLYEESRAKVVFKNATKLESIRFKQVNICYSNVDVRKITIDFTVLDTRIIIDTFYRGRFVEGDDLRDVSDDGRKYFYMSFLEEGEIEILSESIYVELE
jgi:hypothetical protein